MGHWHSRHTRGCEPDIAPARCPAPELLARVRTASGSIAFAPCVVASFGRAVDQPHTPMLRRESRPNRHPQWAASDLK